MRIVGLAENAWKGITPSGGADTMIQDLMAYLGSVGWEVQGVIANGPPGSYLVDGVPVEVCQDKHRMHELVKTADVILTHLGATPRARAMGRTYNIPVAQLIHNSNHYSVGFLGDGVDYAIYNAQWIKDFHQAECNSKIIDSWQGGGKRIIKKRVQSEWPSMVCRPPVNGTGSISNDRDGYITLINLVPNKGPDIFYELAERFPYRRFMAVIGGYQIHDQVIRTDLPNVTIQEHVKDVEEIYSKTSILLVPSIYESYGRVAVEAMQRGIPVIASETPGLKECLGPTTLTRSRDHIEGWIQAVNWVTQNYDSAQEYAINRHMDLEDQTVADLMLLNDQLEGVVRSWGSST